MDSATFAPAIAPSLEMSVKSAQEMPMRLHFLPKDTADVSRRLRPALDGEHAAARVDARDDLFGKFIHV